MDVALVGVAHRRTVNPRMGVSLLVEAYPAMTQTGCCLDGEIRHRLRLVGVARHRVASLGMRRRGCCLGEDRQALVPLA